jgi:hypothetical protein
MSALAPLSPMSPRPQEEATDDALLLASFSRYSSAQYEALSQEIHELHEMFGDLQELVHQQQEPIDLIESNVEQSLVITSKAEETLHHASGQQTRATKTAMVLYVVVGTILGASVGSVGGILIGIKPLATALFGGGLGLIIPLARR